MRLIHVGIAERAPGDSEWGLLVEPDDIPILANALGRYRVLLSTLQGFGHLGVPPAEVVRQAETATVKMRKALDDYFEVLYGRDINGTPKD